jgi:chromosome partitioning protein
VNEDLNLLGVVVTMVDRRKRHPQEVVDDLREIFPEGILFNTQIRELAKIEASPGYHQDIFSYAPNTAAVEDYGAFVEEILERVAAS